MAKIRKYQAEGSDWTIDSPVNDSSYIKLPKELNHSRKALAMAFCYVFESSRPSSSEILQENLILNT